MRGTFFIFLASNRVEEAKRVNDVQSKMDKTWEEYIDEIYNFIVRLTKVEVAEDLTQEVFVKALEKIESFQGRSSFSTWLHSIALNTCRDYWRRQKKNPPPLQLKANQIPNHQNKDSNLSAEDIKSLLLLIPLKYREVLVMREMQDLSYQTIGQVLNLPLGTVKSRIARAREVLRVICLEQGVFEK